MKRTLTIVAVLILLISICGSCTNKKEEEYKAKVKQELDSVQIEETGYKLIETTDYGDSGVQSKRKLTIDGHQYEFGLNNEDNCFSVTVDDKIEDCKAISLSKYGDAFKAYESFYGCWYFDNQIFLIKYKLGDMWNYPYYENYLPPILFLYDYEEDTIKYCGYFEEWFNYRVSKAHNKFFKIIKVKETPNYSDNFEYINNIDGTVSISGYYGEIQNGILNIPEMLDGKTVTKIESYAFAYGEHALSKIQDGNSYNSSSNVLSEITTINIPLSVQEIKNGAFTGLENLVSVNFASDSNLTTLGKKTFAYCKKLKNINLPDGLTKIPTGAFKMCEEFENISLPSSVIQIDKHAFLGCKGSSIIMLPDNVSVIGDGAFAGISQVTAFSISNSNAGYSVKNGVLYSKDQKELVQYPKAKTDTTFTVNPNGTTAYTRTIKSYAFYDCDNLTLVNINDVSDVESFAFADCSALTQMYALGIMHVSANAFSNTAWLQNQLNTKSQAVLGNLLIAYVPEENKKVMELSDWRSDARGIAEHAFISTNLETIYVPSRVSAINNGAFANLATLKNVYFEKIASDTIPSFNVSGRKLFENNHEDLTVYLTRSDYQAITAMETSAFTGINKQMLSTTVNCVKNGVTKQQTLYYDESYTLDTASDVSIWEDSSGQRYSNTGTWKSFESEVTLNALETNESWLYCDDEDISPVALKQGDNFSISFTFEGIITVIVNDETYTINLNLPVGIELRRITDNRGNYAASMSGTYIGQFTRITAEVEEVVYILNVNYYYYYLKPDTNYNIGIEHIKGRIITYRMKDLSDIYALLNEKGSEQVYNEETYYVLTIFDKDLKNEITEFPDKPEDNTIWIVICVKVNTEE